MVDTNDAWIHISDGDQRTSEFLKDPRQSHFLFSYPSRPRFNFQKPDLDPSTIDLWYLVATITPDLHCGCNRSLCRFFYRRYKCLCLRPKRCLLWLSLYGMSVASAAYINSGRYKKVLLIGADKMSSIVDYTDRTTCIIFGDGAGAVLFEPSPVTNLAGKMSI